MNNSLTGTSNFITKFKAIKYYESQSNNPWALVDKKIKAGELSIGEPTLKNGETCFANDEGRYFIQAKMEKSREK